MKAIKIYLIIVSVLLALALAAGVYVWYVIQSTQVQVNDQITVEQTSDEFVNEVEKIGEIEEVGKPIVIEVDSLSETQQKTLQTFGFEGQTLTVTPAMVTCAESAVGNGRFDAIIGGAAPSPLESLKLLPCFKKQ